MVAVERRNEESDFEDPVDVQRHPGHEHEHRSGGEVSMGGCDGRGGDDDRRGKLRRARHLSVGNMSHLHSGLDGMHREARERIGVVALVVVLVNIFVEPWEVQHPMEPVEVRVAVSVEHQYDRQHFPHRNLRA